MLEMTEDERELVKELAEENSESIMEEILKTAHISWREPLNEKDVEEWLSNFSGAALGSEAAERTLARWILSGYVFFNIDDVRSFCSFLFSEFIHKKLVEYRRGGRFLETPIPEQIAYTLSSTVFLALGNDSESGSNVLYYFRQVNKLKKDIFEKDLSEDYENFVFIDDVSISGSQAMTYILKMRESKKFINTYFLTFLATETAIDELNHISVDTICANIISDRDRCFSDESYIFSGKNRRKYLPLAAKMCEYYGRLITRGHPEVEDYPLGFDGAQCLFGFFYNTPDNTLPIFWCESNGWKPLFKRFEKEIKQEEVPISNALFV